jgi:hypothetical protein
MINDGYISWQQFVKLPHIAKLRLTEQTAQYQLYVYQFNLMRIELVRGSGDRIVVIGDLAQEESFINYGQTDYYLLLQEDGSTIQVTARI